MRVKTLAVEFYRSECRARLPFRFGVATLTEAPLLLVHLRLETEDGIPGEGFASDLLVPKWFSKRPDTTIAQDNDDLLRSARRAAAALLDLSPCSVFAAWRRLSGQLLEGPRGNEEGLVLGFGISLMERALIDAACRARETTFFDALREDLFAVDPGAVHPELAHWSLAGSLPPHPADSVGIRHTVGLADPLRRTEIPPDERVEDGFPHSLEEDIETYGLSIFKIKIRGEPEWDVERLLEIARLLDERGVEGARITLDGNEQFESLDVLLRVLDEVAQHPAGERLLEQLLYIEQPLPRHHSFDPVRTAPMDTLTRRAPVILDEADSAIDSFKRAVERGYRGVSVKNCKSVFRALLNRGLCETLGGELFQTSEDLTNLPVIPLHEDLATVAALGIAHSERNGHHYFRGLDHLPREEAREALVNHPDLYRATPDGVALRIENGRLHLGSLQVPGYGYNVELRLDRRQALEPQRR